MTTAQRVLRLAVPNKGRLQEPSASLLRDAGLVFEQTERSLSVRVSNVDLDLLFVRAEDVPELVVDGVVDLGITGQDLLAEHGGEPEVLAELGFGHCRLAVAVPAGSAIEKPEELAGLRVATAHPRVTARYFGDLGVSVDIIPLRGSVEVAPTLGVADAIVDLVSTGSTLLVNGLRVVGTLLASEAVLVAGATSRRERSSNVAEVSTALTAVVSGRRRRYVLLNAPVEAVGRIGEVIPGLEAPTVVPLAEQGWVAVHSVVDADDVWNVLPELEAAGAKGILVLRIEQLIP